VGSVSAGGPQRGARTISPHGLQWDSSIRIVRDNLGYLDIILVPIAALVEPKRPIRDLGREAGNPRVLLSDLDRRRTSKEVKVENSANGIVFQGGFVALIAELDVHAVGVQEEHAVCTSGAVFKIDWVHAVQVCTRWDAIGVPRPHSTGSILGRKAEGLCVFAQTIDVGIERKRRFDAKVLRLEDDRESGSVEEHLVARLAHD
jgi:hypothetical protein